MQLRAGVALDRLGLAAEQRLVELRAARDHRPVGDDLLAGVEVHEIALHDLDRCDRALEAVAHHARARRGEGAQLA